jgi:hypothetical protein
MDDDDIIIFLYLHVLQLAINLFGDVPTTKHVQARAYP